MNVCPICLFVNSATATGCARCKRFQFGGGTAVATAEDPTRAAIGGLPSSPDLCNATRAEGSSCDATKPSGALKSLALERTLPPAPTAPSEMKDAPSRLTDSTKAVRTVLKPMLEVVRGEKIGAVFAVLEGKNIVGRTVGQPADIDLTGQEPMERVWTSRHHSCLHFDGRTVLIEDMNSLNGTFVNRGRLYPGQQRVLHPNDVVQVGTVQLRLIVSAEKVEV